MRTIKFRSKFLELNIGCDKNVGDWVYGELHKKFTLFSEFITNFRGGYLPPKIKNTIFVIYNLQD